MNKAGISRRRFLCSGTASLASLHLLGNCSMQSANTAQTSAPSAQNLSYGNPLKFFTPIPEAADAKWVVDYLNEDDLESIQPIFWRMSLDEFNHERMTTLNDMGLNTDVSREGMEQLNIMGGSDFTANQFAWILEQAYQRADISPDQITVVDLRGETHGLIDGNVFSLWIPNNHVNEGIPTEKAVRLEEDRLQGLRQQDQVELYEADSTYHAHSGVIPLTFDHPDIQSEEEFVLSMGARYIRFANTDHFRPDDHEVELFLDFMEGLPDDQWLYLHCFLGHGRTTCFAIMADIYKNYQKVSFDDIAARQGLIGPLDVRMDAITSSLSHYRKKASLERRVFLQQFYRFAKETGFEGSSWTQWARNWGFALEYYPPALPPSRKSKV